MTRRVIMWGLTGVSVATALVIMSIHSSDDLPWMLAPSVALVLGVLIETRVAGNIIGRLMIAFGVSTLLSGVPVAWLEGAPPGAAAGWTDAVANAINTAGVLLLPMIMLRFPDGRPLSGRWRKVEWLVLVSMAVGASAALLNGGWGGDVGQALAPSPLQEPTSPWGDIASAVFYVLLVVVMSAGALSIFVRFRRSEGEQRHQLKWLVYAGAVLVGVLALVNANPASGWQVLVVGGAFALIPIAVGVAILRYRLYDIDLVINRTLVYATLTAILGLVYVGSVVVLGGLLRPVAGSNDLAVAGSTLAVAALFSPARRRIQGFVDRRFYRSRYDAARTVEAFSARLRDEMDLDALSTDLQAVVKETLQPAYVSVWLRPSPGAGR